MSVIRSRGDIVETPRFGAVDMWQVAIELSVAGEGSNRGRATVNTDSAVHGRGMCLRTNAKRHARCHEPVESEGEPHATTSDSQ